MTSLNGNISVLLAICAGKSSLPSEVPAQRPVTRSFDVFFDLRPNKRLSKHWWGWWFEAPSHHYDVIVMCTSLWRYFPGSVCVCVCVCVGGGGGAQEHHRSITPKFVTPTDPMCTDNNWRSTTLPEADSASSNQTLPFQNEHEWVLEKLR